MELYNVFKKLGADVTENDIIELMTEIDVDRNGEIDIDEFISLMTVGDQINF
jgi:Ca2+-binding EF-hand superfamily protein